MAQPVRISATENNIVISLPYTQRHMMRYFTSKFFDKTEKVWLLNRSEKLARVILKVFQGVPIFLDPSFEELVPELYEYAQDELPPVDTLPAIPLTKTEPWNHQLMAYHFAYPKNAAALFMGMGCIAGETIVRVQHRERKFEDMTVEHLHHKFHGGVTVADIAKPYLLQSRRLRVWDLSKPTKVKGYNGNEQRYLDVVATLYKGWRPVVKLTLQSGKTLRCTPDHEILTTDGLIHAEDLARHHTVVTWGTWIDPAQSQGRNTIGLDHVASVVPDGEAHVYDIACANHHIFAANGIMVRNTGKSKVAVDLVVNRGHQRTLIICPKSVVGVWPKQFDLHAGDDVLVYTIEEGAVHDKLAQIRAYLTYAEKRNKPVVLVINYESAWRPPLGYRRNDEGRVIDKGFFLQTAFDLLVLDESHRIKSPSGKASRFVANLGLRVPYKLLLTGTPMPHSPLDIWSQYLVLDPEVFGTSFTNFKAQYAVMDINGLKVQSWQNKQDMTNRIYSIAFHVGRDVLDLPDAQHIQRDFTLSPLARIKYDQLEEEFYTVVEGYIARGDKPQIDLLDAEDRVDEDSADEKAEGEVTIANVLVKLLRLQQMTSGYVVDDDKREIDLDNGKQKLLEDILEDLNEPVVVFCRFRHDLDVIKLVCDKLKLRYGELSGRSKSGLAPDSTMQSNIDVLGTQIRSGGVGVDLTRARICIFFSVGYSLGDYDQALARVHRPGQTQAVIYYHLLGKGTIDEAVYASLEEKREVVESILHKRNNVSRE